MDPKYEAVYRILLSFMMVDGDINENEKKKVIEFLNSKFGEKIPKDLQNVGKHKDKLNKKSFLEDVKLVFEGFLREDIFEILDFIAQIIKSDGRIDNKEIDLFKTVLENWKIEKSMIETLGLKKSFLSSIFG